MNDSLSHGRRATVVSVVVNGVLALVKLVAGILGHSYALIADAIESLGDIFGAAIVWGGLTIAAKPADENHPYGHGKAEPLAALAVALMLVGAGIGIAINAIREIHLPHHAPASYTLVVLIAVVVIKEAMYRYESATARRIRSTAISVDAWHHRGDALTSAAAAVGITIALVGGEGYESADDWAALAACLVIVGNGARFVRYAVGELMDTAPAAVEAESIRASALEVAGAELVEKVVVRKMGPSVFVDLHLEVDPSMSVLDAHGIAHAVKDRIKSNFPHVADVLVHLEPHTVKKDRDS